MQHMSKYISWVILDMEPASRQTCVALADDVDVEARLVVEDGQPVNQKRVEVTRQVLPSTRFHTDMKRLMRLGALE